LVAKITNFTEGFRYRLSYNSKDFLFQKRYGIDQTKDWSCIVNRSEIEYWSKNREDCVKYLKLKKFNLK